MALSIARISSPRAATASVIFLHGLGDSGDGWSFLPHEVHKHPSLQHIDFLLPSAQSIPISMFGQSSPAWFDLSSLGPPTSKDATGVSRSIALVDKLIDQVMDRGIPSERIILGGFSQGAAITESFAIMSRRKLGGFLCLSGFLPDKSILKPNPANVNKDTPLCMLHGTVDDIVPIETGKVVRDQLKSHYGFRNVEWHEYPGVPHSIDLNGLQDVLKFIEKTLT